MPQCCAVPMCSNKTGGHRFPTKDTTRLEQWLVAIRRDKFTPNKHSVVCKSHFTADDYELPKESVLDKPRLTLKKMAVPSQFQWNEPSFGHPKKKVGNQKRLARNQKQLQVHINDDKEKDDMVFMETSNYCEVQIECDQEQIENGNQSDFGTEGPPEREPPQPPPLPKEQKPLPPKCKACGVEEFSGFIYECMQCEYRLCGACEKAGAHREHYILRVPPHSSKEELERVLIKVYRSLRNVKFERPPSLRDINPQIKPIGDLNGADDELPHEPEQIVEIKMELQVEHDPFGDVPDTSVKIEQVDESFEDQGSATGQDAGTEREAIYGRVPEQNSPVVEVPSGSEPDLMSSTTYSEAYGRVPSQNIADFQEPSASKPALFDCTSYSQDEVEEITIKSEPPDFRETSDMIVSHPASKRPADSRPKGITRKRGQPKRITVPRKFTTRYDIENLRRAIEDVRCRRLTLGRAAATYSVPKTTLFHQLQQVGKTPEQPQPQS